MAAKKGRSRTASTAAVTVPAAALFQQPNAVCPAWDYACFPPDRWDIEHPRILTAHVMGSIGAGSVVPALEWR
jgi:hypothetical protein